MQLLAEQVHEWPAPFVLSVPVLRSLSLSLCLSLRWIVDDGRIVGFALDLWGFFFGVFVFRRLRERDGTNVVGFLFFVVSFRRPGVVDVGVTGGRDRSIGTRRVTPGVRSEAIRFLIRTDLAPGHLLLLVVVVVDFDVDVAIVRVSRRKGTARNGKSKNYKKQNKRKQRRWKTNDVLSANLSVLLFVCFFLVFYFMFSTPPGTSVPPPCRSVKRNPITLPIPKWIHW